MAVFRLMWAAAAVAVLSVAWLQPNYVLAMDDDKGFEQKDHSLRHTDHFDFKASRDFDHLVPEQSDLQSLKDAPFPPLGPVPRATTDPRRVEVHLPLNERDTENSVASVVNSLYRQLGGEEDDDSKSKGKDDDDSKGKGKKKGKDKGKGEDDDYSEGKSKGKSKGKGKGDESKMDPDDSDFDTEIKHYPAKSLHYLKNKIDEDMFSWINKDEIKPGGVTCGFLTPPLGSLPDEPYPRIKVYFCMRFAKKQPASKGYLVIHCGGPSSLSGCGFYEVIGKENLKHYNVITFDQRGLGRSWPNFAHEECTYGLVLDDEGSLQQDPNEGNAFTVDPTDEADIRAFLSRQKRRLANCWTCTTCDFDLEATDGSKTYHFLDFSGTQQAIEDIKRFVHAIGAEKVSLWGLSYGTSIVSLYATAFPNTVDKLILDSNQAPLPDAEHYALATARNKNTRVSYLIYSCSAVNVAEPGTCPVDDLGLCINQVSDIYTEILMENPDYPSFAIFFQHISSIVAQEGDWNALEDICLAAEAQDKDALKAIISALIESLAGRRNARNLKESDSQPTSEDNVLGNPMYPILMDDDSAIPQTLILGQSWTGGAYDDEYVIYQVKRINEQYPAYGTYLPSRDFMYWYCFTFYWPKPQPVSPSGNSFLTGIVTGALYDPATPYMFTQEMKQAFPETVLITSQWITHGIGLAIDEEGAETCINLFKEYLWDGYVSVPDGFVCGSPLPGPFEAGSRRKW